MKHKIGYNRLGKKASHRKAMLRNMATSLFRYERIRTTRAKAKELRRFAEPIVTRAKVDSVHNRRIVAKSIGDKSVLYKLFTELGPKYVSRPGGYTRTIKIGHRQGDAAEMVLIELVEELTAGETAKKTTKTRKATKPKAEDRAVEDSTADESESEASLEGDESAAVEPEQSESSSEEAVEPNTDSPVV